MCVLKQTDKCYSVVDIWRIYATQRNWHDKLNDLLYNSRLKSGRIIAGIKSKRLDTGGVVYKL